MPLIGILRFRLEALAFWAWAWLVEHRQVAYPHALVHRRELLPAFKAQKWDLFVVAFCGLRLVFVT